MKLNCVMISGEKAMDEFFRRADLFEPFKAYAKCFRVQLTLKPGCTKEKAIQDMCKVFRYDGHRVVAAFVPGSHEGSFVDESVRVVSNGTSWCLLEDLLSKLNYVSAPKL